MKLLLAALLSLSSAIAAGPNIILVYMDDMGWGDLGTQGAVGFETPNLDQMAAEGLRMTKFYSVCSVCSASRAGLMTGCYPARVMKTAVLFPDSTTALHPDEVTIADTLGAAGYKAHMVGKWHLGHQPEVMPTAQGFESYYGVPYSNDMGCDPAMTLAADCVFRKTTTRENFVSTAARKTPLSPLMRGTEIVEVPSDQATLTKRYTEEAVSLISEHGVKSGGENPLFLYYAHTMPHKPIFASEAFAGTTERGEYGDVISEVDWSIGELLKAVHTAGISENTLIVFSSDNGPWNRESMTHLRAGKFTNFEGGQRVPLIAWWPGTIEAGRTSEELGATIDLHPSLATIAGAEFQTRDGSAADGIDLSSHLLGKDESTARSDFYYWGPSVGEKPQGVRDERWKLLVTVKRRNGDKNTEKPPFLYDLLTDEREKNNVADQHPEVVERLTGKIDAYAKKVAASRRTPWMAEAR